MITEVAILVAEPTPEVAAKFHVPRTIEVCSHFSRAAVGKVS